jgi:hypothetical protein
VQDCATGSTPTTTLFWKKKKKKKKNLVAKRHFNKASHANKGRFVVGKRKQLSGHIVKEDLSPLASGSLKPERHDREKKKKKKKKNPKEPNGNVQSSIATCKQSDNNVK